MNMQSCKPKFSASPYVSSHVALVEILVVMESTLNVKQLYVDVLFLDFLEKNAELRNFQGLNFCASLSSVAGLRLL